MKAIVMRKYGAPDLLSFEDIARPVPEPNQVLVKVHAASVNAADWHLMRAQPFLVRFANGWLGPKQPVQGMDVAGVVETVGSAITRFKPGDAVFGAIKGAFAEFACGTDQSLAHLPAGLSFVDAATIAVAGVTALQALRDHAQIKPGQRVLINGAASGVGAYAVQLAKMFGAHVTAVAGPDKLALLHHTGADRVLVQTQTDVLLENELYDVIIDNAAFRPSKAFAKIMTPQGAYVTVGGNTFQLFRNLLFGKKTGTGQRFVGFIAKIESADIATLGDWMASGKIFAPIDRSFPLSQTAEAIRYMEARKVKGKISIRVV